MAGPFVVLRTAQGTPLLAWGSDVLRANPALRQPYRAIVLTADGLQDPAHRLEAQGMRVLRCPYLDNPNLAQAQAAVNRCAPTAAQWVAAGIPTLVTCAAGENRSGLMTAAIASRVTGQPGAAIVAQMKGVANPTCPGRTRGCVFTNNVFRRWAESWPAREAVSTTSGGMPRWAVIGGGALLAASAIGLLALTMSLKPTVNRRRRRRTRR